MGPVFATDVRPADGRETGGENAPTGAKVDDPGRPRKGYIRGLDGVRALAIGLVLFAHSVINDQFSHLRPIGLCAGYAGVAIFFVMSGYLITTLLLREEEQTGDISLGLFYIRRALRLFPALWLYLLVVGALWLAGRVPDHPWHSFASSLLYIRNIVGRGHETAHLWSLSIEEQFYFLWPLVMPAMPRRNRARLAFAIGVLAFVTAWRVYAARTGLVRSGTLYLRSDFRFDGPLYGCALALTLHIAPRVFGWTNSTGARSGLLAIAGTAGLALWVGLGLGDAVYPGTDLTVASLLGVILILSQVGAQGAGSRWLAWGPLVAIGQISYGLYLWQQLLMGPLRDGFVTIRTFPVGLIATFAAAYASNRLVERPFLRLKDSRFHKPVRPLDRGEPGPSLRLQADGG